MLIHLERLIVWFRSSMYLLIVFCLVILLSTNKEC